MATRKGQRRKTARRAYMPRRKGRTYHKPAKQLNLLMDAAGLYIVGDALTTSAYGQDFTPYDTLKNNGYNPFANGGSGVDYGKSAVGMVLENVAANKVKYAEAAIIGIAGEYIGRNTAIGRKLAYKSKKWNIKLF